MLAGWETRDSYCGDGLSQLASSFAAAAPSFDRHRRLPHGVPEAVRAALVSAAETSAPRILDLGAGTGRIGRAFVRTGDDYVGVDLSLGMLREFARRREDPAPRLVQADGRALPFSDAAFDAVMLIQVFGGLRGWLRLIEEARRVLRAEGALVLGRVVAPQDGVDARMKRRLAALLGEMGIATERANARENVEQWLEACASNADRTVAATWQAERTPRAFLERHPTGARFSALPEPVKDEALRRLAKWATKTFGALDTASSERHEFELRIFRFGREER